MISAHSSGEVVRELNVVLAFAAWLLLSIAALRYWRRWTAHMRLVKQGLAFLCLSVCWGSIEATVDDAPPGSRVYFVAVSLVWVIVSQLLPTEGYVRRERDDADC